MPVAFSLKSVYYVAAGLDPAFVISSEARNLFILYFGNYNLLFICYLVLGI